MKTKLGIIFLMVVLFSTVLGQRRPSIEERIEALKIQLDLTDEQVEDIRLILNNAREQEKQQWILNKGEERAMRAAAKERQEFKDRQIENILTPEQKIRYKEIRDKEPKFSDPQLIELVNRLNLSDEQAGKVEKILISARIEKEEKRNSSGDRRDMFENIKKIQNKTDQQIEEILNKEQKEVFKKYCAERDEKMKNERGQRPGPGRMR